MAKRLGAQIVQVSPGYLKVVQARAEEYYSHQTGALLAPFGFDIPGAAQHLLRQRALSVSSPTKCGVRVAQASLRAV